MGSIFFITTFILSIYISYNPTFASHPYDYCSFKGEYLANARAIPPRSGANMQGEFKLEQVNIMIRHGIRTTGSEATAQCFPHLMRNPHSWNCEWKDVMQGYHENSSQMTTKFMRNYDTKPQDNRLGGTCLSGQLMSMSIDQYDVVSDSIVASYFSENPIFTPEEFSENPNIFYLRSTDYQRTKASASIVVTQFMEKAGFPKPSSPKEYIKIHSMDLSRENLSIGNPGCQNRDEVDAPYYTSNEFYLTQATHQDLYKKVAAIALDSAPLDDPHWGHFYWDCYLAYVCHDMQENLPEEIRVNRDSDENSLGVQFYQALEEELTGLPLYNNSASSRCVINDFVYDFTQGLKVSGSTDPDHQAARDAKLVFYSAHDTSCYNFLSSIQVFDRTFPSYASLMTFEVYSDTDGGEYFRLTFNGKEFTGDVANCANSETFINEGVCEMSEFYSATEWVVKKEQPSVY